ncbi:uncharacterized protein LOC130369578 [Hyla sarda]|uniref:uncharacterized protein LOC130369578 n=1 Tax=Hyla sarda TaxID=327740 RepID=UPI0024C39AF6|nr:uncharacterized protein LOC130369578 [Hyla sarda]XP_056430968.1 uncharacterized protein LOC130369578 [Hyla sarda]
MAMQKHFHVRDCHQRSITALGFHTARREFLTGFEDGMIKWWDLDSGRLSQSAAEHSGMVTKILYWTETKLVFSSSNDGTLIVWTSGAVVLDKIRLGSPIYSIAINLRRHLLVCGFKKHLSIYPLDEQKTCGHVINIKKCSSDYQHTDIVSCIVSLDSQIYTVGYDRKFLIFDTYQTPDKICLRVVHSNLRAHEAGITHLLLVRERESTRFLTGSFDRTVGVWSQDGQLIQRLQQFTGEITGMCYVPYLKTVWITSGNGHPLVLDPRSGDIISNFLDTFQSGDDSPQIKRLACLPETSHVIGSTRNQVIMWKYQKAGCVTILHAKHPLECLSYTGKKLLLLFIGDSNGIVDKWKRNDLSPFTYSKESYDMEDSRPERRGLRCLLQKQMTELIRRPQSRMQRPGTAGILRKGIIFNNQRPLTSQTKSCGYTKSLFSDEMDMLVMATECGDIYLWEFDDSVSGPFQEEDDEQHRLKIPMTGNSPILEESGGLINKHLAGFTCKKVLAGHVKAVTSLIVVGKGNGYSTVYLLSGGWDRRLCVWDLLTCTLIETFSRPEMDHWDEQKETACDGVIMDMCFCPKRKEFAYSSSDGNIYIRQFGAVSSEMILVNILRGHEAEVTSVVWHNLKDKWITGSEDGTIRIWSEEGALCERVLHTKGVVMCICIDQMNGCIAAGVHDTIRVYDPDTLLQVQCNVGHTDLIRCIVHIPEMKQYASVSWDRTVRLWKAYYKANQYGSKA